MQRNAWREAAWVFGLSRLALLLITFAGISNFPPLGQAAPRHCTPDLTPCLQAWWRWDVVHYVDIASKGYIHLYDTAFFPFWPLLMHVVGALFGGSPTADYAAGLLLANLWYYLALVFFYELVSTEFEPAVAKIALFYLSFSPFSLYFFAGYTESLFLFLSLLIFWLLRRGRPLDWWLAGLCGFVATLTRSTGIALAVPFLVLAGQRFWLEQPDRRIRWRELVNALLPICLLGLALLTYMAYLWQTRGDPFLFSKQEEIGWQRHLTFPWTGIVSAVLIIFTSPGGAFNVQDIIFTIIPLIVLCVGWKRLPWHYSLFALTMILFFLSHPAANKLPLASAPRYMQAVFPITIIFALWARRYPRFDRLYLAICLPFFVINTILFISYVWIA
ncbi:mannosyltransferase family protein [Tengunoibacter tsumagoiensis]|uniref:Glycosyltransferase RgtA/B/C/D-like domain-containing protein n=1 Tax=Tengunoibacter tsumagoiensis TaxID=2014871 RepID=A0A401ZWP7_9CHLR|nr:mannosyltransferase family protein [Tengunoibacter tsumagoiensis]GCE11293.1 hypothetical protein KTT_11520 [Tengunoibacter tsumagoiensis]